MKRIGGVLIASVATAALSVSLIPAPAFAADIPVSTQMTITPQIDSPEDEPEDLVDQDFAIYDSVVTSFSDRFNTRTVRFQLPDGCQTQTISTYVCVGRTFDFRVVAYDDKGAEDPLSVTKSSTAVTAKADFISPSRKDADIIFSMYGTERVDDGVTPAEIVDEVVAMAKAGESFASDAELAAEEEELNAGSEEASSSGQPAVSAQASSKPSKVGIPSSYVYCSKSNRKKLSKCKPASLHDYCSYSPDKPYILGGAQAKQVDFRGPCARHDMGIGTIIKAGGSLTTKRKKRANVDTRLKAHMYQNCSNAFWGSNWAVKKRNGNCRSTASVYYAAVKAKTKVWNGK